MVAGAIMVIRIASAGGSAPAARQQDRHRQLFHASTSQKRGLSYIPLAKRGAPTFLLLLRSRRQRRAAPATWRNSYTRERRGAESFVLCGCSLRRCRAELL